MNKKILIAILPALLMTTAAMACNNNAVSINLIQKDPTTWATVPGASGTFSYWTQTSFNIEKTCTTKTKMDCDWKRVDRAWQKVCNPVQYKDCDYSRVKVETQKFDFDGKNLTPGTAYSLISYAEPYPSVGCVLLGTATANSKGKVSINGAMKPLVYNVYATDASGDYKGVTGAKIWLVPSSDVTCPAGFSAWNPAQYLFESALIQ